MALSIELVESECVVVDYRQDHLPPLTVGLYEAFIAHGAKGREALAVYMHLLYTYRRQGTNQPWATVRYLHEGLKMGGDRVKVAKALLHEMGLIEYVQAAGAKGHFGKTYTRLNLLPNPGPTGGVKIKPAVTGGVINRPAVNPSSGPENELLEEETKFLAEGIKKEGGIPESRTSTAPARAPEASHAR